MKKAIKLIALFIVLCMAMTTILAACQKDCGDGKHTDENHDGVCDVCKKDGLTVTHTGGVATCQKRAVCEVCGQEYGELGEHNWDASTNDCQHKPTCTVCGETSGDFGPHNFVAAEDCLHEGTCSVCGETDGVIGPHTDEGDKYQAATCQKLAKCGLCGKEYGTLAGHSFELQNGKEICSVCGYEFKAYLALGDYLKTLKTDLDRLKSVIGAVNAEVDKQVNDAYLAGVDAIQNASSVETALEAFDAAKKNMAECIPLANGVYSFTNKTYEEKLEILGILESSAIRNGMTGITVYEDGGYVMYDPSVTLGTENYIPGYGFGVLSEGSITADLEKESNSEWKRYYHTFNANDPGTVCYADDQGSEVGDFFSYIGASYFTTFMNDTKDGYEWVPELAASMPEPVGETNDYGQTAKWRFELRKDLKYNTLSTLRAKYNNRAVALEDFVTPYKLLLNQANGFYRGQEQSTATGAQAIAGVKAYYSSTKDSPKGILSNEEADFSKVGIKAYEEDGKWYFEYELGAPVNQFYAMYYISSSLYMPVPKEFIDEVGVDYYQGYNADKTQTPVDNSLSLGAYTLERWDSNQQVVYKKNPNYVYASTKYKIEGIHINILPAATTDPEAGIKEFLDGKIHASGIPETMLSQYKDDPRTRVSQGSSCVKLNVNALDQDTWETLFGVEGTVTQTPRSQYWECEPALSNAHFRQALSYSINRQLLADKKGFVGSVDFFSSNYMYDPEKGLSYSTTDAHKKALNDNGILVENGTDQYGYSRELAIQYFKMALNELESAGIYKPGTELDPTVITIEIAWQAASQEQTFHKYIKQFWEDTFNDRAVSDGKYRLEVVFWVGDIWSDVYYNKMMLGQFDIGFGSISGNPLDPLSFLNVLSSDQSISGNFTLNWGIDTSDPDADILVFDGVRWSFDALFKASQETTYVVDGKVSPWVSVDEKATKFEKTNDGVKATITLSFAEGVEMEVGDFVLFGSNFLETGDYNEFSVMDYVQGDPVETDNSITYTLLIPNSEIAKFGYSTNQGIDIYLGYEIEEYKVSVPVDLFTSVYYDFVAK